MSTTRGCATPVLSDDHIDLIITAAMRWHVITSRTAAAFSSSPAENHALVATAHEAGRMLRTENRAAIAWLAERGRVRPGDQAAAGSYVHCPVERLHPVEVIKAAHAAQAACHDSPAWATSSARRLLEAVVTSATHRLEGYADAPWAWTRPTRRGGTPVGILAAGEQPPPVPQLTWVTEDAAREVWDDAALVLVTVAAASVLPADLAGRSGVFVLTQGEDHNQVWDALTALEMEALVLFWPQCGDWLAAQMQDPSPEFVEHRSSA